MNVKKASRTEPPASHVVDGWSAHGVEIRSKARLMPCGDDRFGKRFDCRMNTILERRPCGSPFKTPMNTMSRSLAYRPEVRLVVSLIDGVGGRGSGAR